MQWIKRLCGLPVFFVAGYFLYLSFQFSDQAHSIAAHEHASPSWYVMSTAANITSAVATALVFVGLSIGWVLRIVLSHEAQIRKMEDEVRQLRNAAPDRAGAR